MSKAVMSSFWTSLAFAGLVVAVTHNAAAQPLGANPSAAPSDIRNPSSINPSAAASDIRNPSAINPSAARSQIPQPTVTPPGQAKLSPRTNIDSIAPARRPAHSPQRSRSRRAAEMDNVTRPFEALEASNTEMLTRVRELHPAVTLQDIVRAACYAASDPSPSAAQSVSSMARMTPLRSRA